MSEEKEVNPFNVERIYLEEASLKIFNAPASFALEQTPSLDINLQVDKTALEVPGFYTVSVTATLHSYLTEGSATTDVFKLTAKQSGLFRIQGLDDNTVYQVLGVTCPTIIYPFLRASVSEMLAHSTLPQVYLAQINFEEFFKKGQQEVVTGAQNAPKAQA